MSALCCRGSHVVGEEVDVGGFEHPGSSSTTFWMDKQEEKGGEGGPRGVEKVGWGGELGSSASWWIRLREGSLSTLFLIKYLGFCQNTFIPSIMLLRIIKRNYFFKFRIFS